MVPNFEDIWYTRPIAPSIHSVNSQSSGTRSPGNGIPEGLQLKLILGGHTCPPCSVRDFKEYLDRIEHSGENLAFYLWFKEYKTKFFKMPQELQELSPKPYFEALESSATTRIPKLVVRGRLEPQSPSAASASTAIDSDTGGKEEERRHPEDNKHFLRPSSSDDKMSEAGLYTSYSGGDDSECVSSEASKHPFRDEVDAMSVLFLTAKGAKELNLPSQLRARTIQAVRETTHPDVFEPVNDHVWDLLLRSSHPNFIRYIIRNGNIPRVRCAHFLGALMIILGFLEALMCIGYGVGRAWRIFSLPLFLIGAATSCAASYGMCAVLHGLHRRQLSPWELFRDEESGEYAPEAERKLRIFDKEVWVEEPALRQLHDRIFYQSLALASLFTICMAAIFLSVPNVKH